MKWLLLTALIFIFDLWTKNFASQNLQMHNPVYVIPSFNLTLTHNTGAAFSILANASGWQRYFFIFLTLVVSTFIVTWLYSLKANQRWIACALALILGGALGNLWDRIILGYVVDFIDISLSFLPWRIFNPWPAFNIADSAISIGTVMLVINVLLFSDKTE